ncbi:MAG TPA: hypothetical protein VMW65_17095 [Chloroflexota bacterium]|nr:hypothetical protein [Chloroflexota bacterium]
MRCSEARPRWHNNLYRWIENRYLRTLDGYVYNSQTTRQVVEYLIHRDDGWSSRRSDRSWQQSTELTCDYLAKVDTG